jgi:acetyl esterase/lipase
MHAQAACLLLFLTAIVAVAPSNQVGVVRDVTYCTVTGLDLKMDLYYPNANIDEPLPVLVYVHGGAWFEGDKAHGAGMLDISELLSRSYIVASVNYRLGPQYPFPAQIIDVKCAIRSLRENALSLHIDPDRIGVWGSSSGGELVSLLGVTSSGAGFDIGQYSEQSSRVEAVVDEYGITDLTTPTYGFTQNFYSRHEKILQKIFGSLEIRRSASPVNYVLKGVPPFLIIHGACDQIVPLNQSELLYNRLTDAGVNAKLLVVKNSGHDFVAACGPIDPTREQITKIMADFFDRNLHPVSQLPSIDLDLTLLLGGIAVVVLIVVLVRRKPAPHEEGFPQSSGLIYLEVWR